MISKYLLIFVSLMPMTNILALNSKVHYLENDDMKSYRPEQRRLGFFESDIQIYCYSGSNKILWRYFQTNYLNLDIETDDYTQYEGSTPEIVKSHHDEQKSIFQFSFLSYKKSLIKLNPFNQTCIGIDTLQPYTIRLILIRGDLWKIFYFIVGLTSFMFASNLSKNSFFFYLSGVTLGICASFVILVFLAGKLFPRRPMMYGVLIGGWTIAYYLIKLLWDNVQLILISYYTYVLWYIIITGFLSFIICYRMGPPTNKRSKNLIKWSLQLVALIFIYFSSELREASVTVIALIILFNYLPLTWFKTIGRIYIRWFPPKRRLLTLEEYEDQGIIETKKALDNLRQYCSSPECKQWKMMTCLKNPKRFASFVEGDSHLYDEEVFDHDSSKVNLTDSDISGDEDVFNHQNENVHNDVDDDDDDELSEDEEYVEPKKLLYRGGSLSARKNGDSSKFYEQNNHGMSTSYIYHKPQKIVKSPPSITTRTRYPRTIHKINYTNYDREYSDD